MVIFVIVVNIVNILFVLWGIDCRIVYVYKKYYLGLIIVGVFILLIGCYCRGLVVKLVKVNVILIRFVNSNVNFVKFLIE